MTENLVQDIPLIPRVIDKLDADVSQLWKDAYETAVKIELVNKEGKVIDSGSGFLLGDKGDHVGGAWHVTDPGKGRDELKDGSITVTTVDGKKYKATIEEKDEKGDQVYLKLDTGKDVMHPGLPVSKDDKLKVGEDVLALTYPFGGGLVASLGEVEKYETMTVEMPRTHSILSLPVVKSTFIVMPGSSGGLVVRRNPDSGKTEIAGDVSNLYQGEFAGSFRPPTNFRRWLGKRP